MTIYNKFKNWLSAPVNGHVIGLFRIIYGLFMIKEIWRYISDKMVKTFFVDPKVNFPYDGLEWLKPMSASSLELILKAMVFCAVLITLGVVMKWAARLFALMYAYIFLLDTSLYNNHIYLFILLAVLLSFTDADQFLSLRKRKLPGIAVPRWQQFMLGAQVMCVYFFASLVKMRADWWVLHEPVKSIAASIPESSWLAPLYKSEMGLNMMVYLGFGLDFFAPLLLWYKPLRNWAVIPFALFHYSNSQIFGDIGNFPFMMMAALILYFEMEEIPFLKKWFPVLDKKNRALASPVIGNFTRVFLILYFTFQVLFPLRGLFLPNDLDYTTIGNRFSWRVKADSRVVEEYKFILKDPVSGREGEINLPTKVNNVQAQAMLYDPRSIRRFAQLIHEQSVKNNIPNAQLIGKIKFSLNGRPAQYFVDPEVDLMKVEYSPFKRLEWVVPLER
ncbi:MAG: HTTM domain-containing protein [Saprospiraceae bacterium]|nr:HTTM domain-containing protein [Saprospiraceae bacterium]MCB9343029.1 HTTM domain-containing protein [Lewinellaceae bacterium]